MIDPLVEVVAKALFEGWASDLSTSLSRELLFGNAAITWDEANDPDVYVREAVDQYRKRARIVLDAIAKHAPG
jgi:hypothetical protein